jgi:hypothetical protein
VFFFGLYLKMLVCETVNKSSSEPEAVATGLFLEASRAVSRLTKSEQAFTLRHPPFGTRSLLLPVLIRVGDMFRVADQQFEIHYFLLGLGRSAVLKLGEKLRRRPGAKKVTARKS